jgi:hypothetical protein
MLSNAIKIGKAAVGLPVTMEFPEDYMQFRGTDAAQPAEQSLQVSKNG